jgi:hypothetical protein
MVDGFTTDGRSTRQKNTRPRADRRALLEADEEDVIRRCGGPCLFQAAPNSSNPKRHHNSLDTMFFLVVPRQYSVRPESLTFAQQLARLQAMRKAFRTVAALRSAMSGRGHLLLEILALRHHWVSSPVRIDASAALTVYSGCACDGCGPGGGRPLCWPNRPQSPVGIAKRFRGCWRHRSRPRPGRPRIDLPLRRVIERMATENCL